MMLPYAVMDEQISFKALHKRAMSVDGLIYARKCVLALGPAAECRCLWHRCAQITAHSLGAPSLQARYEISKHVVSNLLVTLNVGQSQMVAMAL